VVEQVAAALPHDAQLGFYRNAAGAELDPVIERGHTQSGCGNQVLIRPQGFWQALQDLQIDRTYVIAPRVATLPVG